MPIATTISVYGGEPLSSVFFPAGPLQLFMIGQSQTKFAAHFQERTLCELHQKLLNAFSEMI